MTPSNLPVDPAASPLPIGRAAGSAGVRVCMVHDCDERHYARGYCRLHWERRSRTGSPHLETDSDSDRFWSLLDRLWDKVATGPQPRDELARVQSCCWLWVAYLNAHGYGVIGVGSRTDGTRRTELVHRVAYDMIVGPIPDDMETDHLCRVRNCVRPDHMEVVTHAENVRRGNGGNNMRRKTHCPKGHPYAGDNLYVDPRGGRRCRTCRATQ